jgi:hypothetical protein
MLAERPLGVKPNIHSVKVKQAHFVQFGSRSVDEGWSSNLPDLDMVEPGMEGLAERRAAVGASLLQGLNPEPAGPKAISNLEPPPSFIVSTVSGCGSRCATRASRALLRIVALG